MDWVFPGLLALLGFSWLGVAALSLRSFLEPRPLDPLEPQPTPWPLVSVIVTALDEEATIEPALRTLLSASYPELELIAVNDRSRDRTGEVIDRLAADSPRLQPVHIRELPGGWLGKVHAMDTGARAARGEWLLFTDADVHFGPTVIERAIQVCQRERLDHLTLWPRLEGRGLVLRAALVAFMTNLLLLLRPHRIGGEDSRGFVGIGAFNLVRRAALEKTPGLEWLKMEIVDDTGLARMMVDHGCRSSWRSAIEELSVEWYPSLSAMIRGLEKNMYGAFSHFRLSVFLGKLAAILPFVVGPYMAILLPGPWWQKLAGFTALGVWISLAWLAARPAGYGLVEAVLAPFLGAGIMFTALARSTWMTLRNGGIRWRGTFYPIAELRAGARLRL
jgi:glycosyltransferase involved in cell wall biosynthesis